MAPIIRNGLLFLTFFLLGSIFDFTYAQEEGNGGMCSIAPPVEWLVIELADGTEVEILAFDGMINSRIDMHYGDFTVSIYLDDTQSASFYIHETGFQSNWGQGKFSMNGRNLTGGIVDTGYMPPEYLEVWDLLRSLCGELIDNDAFWEIVRSEFEDESHIYDVNTGLSAMRDGYYEPNSEVSAFSISFKIKYDAIVDIGSARTYALNGEDVVILKTQSAFGDPEPEIYMVVLGGIEGGHWNFHIIPDEQLCELSQPEGFETMYPQSDEDWELTILDVVSMLNLFREYVPELAEDGLIPYPDDLLTLMDQSLEGLTSFEYIHTTPGEF
jgi:hypothetical protein